MSSLPAITWPLVQKAVYWSPSTVDAYGQPTWGAPVEIDVRWDGRREEFLDLEGTRQVSRAVVILDRNVEVQGVLLLGQLTTSVDTADPKKNAGAFEIRMFQTNPDVAGVEELKQAFL